MLQNNTRIESLNGMHFYEQDVCMLDYTYTQDFKAVFTLDYASPGFGLVIATEKRGAKDESNNAFLFKIGLNSYTVYHKWLSEQTKIATGSVPVAADGSEKILTFKKTGRFITLYNRLKDRNVDLEIAGFQIPEKYFSSKYRIGIYSNAGNTVKNLSIYDLRPQFWFTNIQNTNGGRISFKRDCFVIEQAEKPIELEQQNIPLEKGTYWLSYDVEAVNEKMWLKTYLFPSTEDKIDAPKKNLLKEDGSFVLDEPTNVNILFQGKSCSVSNIAIKNDPNQSYVSTEGSAATKEGSKCSIDLQDLKAVEWSGAINAIPVDKLTDKISYFVEKFGIEKDIYSLNVNLKEHYTFKFELVSGNSWRFSIQKDSGTAFFTEVQTSTEAILQLFFNIAGYIDKLLLTMKNGEVIDVMNQKTYKKFVPMDIQSPIIVTDEYNAPFDLSSCYRYVTSSDTYIFTNYAREVCLPKEGIVLDNDVLSSANSLIVYGIPGDIDKDKIYDISSPKKVNSIDECVEAYDIVGEEYYSLTDGRMLELSQEILDGRYKNVIVEYLKADSYAINVDSETEQYEVDIATEKPKFIVTYDMEEDGSIESTKVIDGIAPEDNSFISLYRKEEP